MQVPKIQRRYCGLMKFLNFVHHHGYRNKNSQTQPDRNRYFGNPHGVHGYWLNKYKFKFVSLLVFVSFKHINTKNKYL